MNLKRDMAQHLTETILPFWTGLKDTAHGGFVGFVGHDLQADADAPKGCIHNSRILWFFSEAYTLLKQPALLDCARHAYRYVDHFTDKTEGGLYWMLSADGTPMDTTKHTYNHAFAIYALAAYARAGGSKEALAQALALYTLIEERMVEGETYADAFNREFRPLSNLKLSDNETLLARGVVAEKTMNTLLHVMEAYTLLYTVSGDARVGSSLRKLLELLREKVYNPEKNRLEVFFDSELRSLIDMQSYGHDIEASWLWDLAADAVLTGDARRQVRQLTARLAKGVLERAFDGESLENEIVEGKTDARRIWWVQAETMVGLCNLWQKTGDPALTAQMEALWRYIRENLVDRRPGGEWFAAAHPQGEPRALPVVDPWKAPYHNGRMCMEMMKRL